eukprot:m.192993 g.192993  ORF g.192993 m.192993 type:complete len:320 (-) comp10065_c0_seq3:1174-2133(-)
MIWILPLLIYFYFSRYRSRSLLILAITHFIVAIFSPVSGNSFCILIPSQDGNSVAAPIQPLPAVQGVGAQEFVDRILCLIEEPSDFCSMNVDVAVLQRILAAPLAVKLPVPGTCGTIATEFPALFQGSCAPFDRQFWMLLTSFSTPLLIASPTSDATEMAVGNFISYFFQSLPEILLRVAQMDLPLKFKRNQRESFVSAGAPRPDFTMMMRFAPVLLGQEKAGTTQSSAAVAVLSDVLNKHAGGHRSTFGPVRYYFHYTADTESLSLYARSLERDSEPLVLHTYRFDSLSDRQAMIIAAINLIRIAPGCVYSRLQTRRL